MELTEPNERISDLKVLLPKRTHSSVLIRQKPPQPVASEFPNVIFRFIITNIFFLRAWMDPVTEPNVDLAKLYDQDRLSLVRWNEVT